MAIHVFKTSSVFESVCKGRVEFDLGTATLALRGRQCRGHGQIEWRNDAGFSVRAVTDGAEAQLRASGEVPGMIGQIIPPEDYLQLEGESHCGRKLFLARMHSNVRSVSNSDPFIFWSLTDTDVVGWLEAKGPKTRPDAGHQHVLLLRNDLGIFGRATERTSVNDLGQSEQFEVDCLRFSCSIGEVSAMRIASGGTLVQMPFTHNVDYDLFEQSLLAAISFVRGRLTACVASESTSEDGVTTRISPLWRAREGELLVSPFGYSRSFGDTAEDLLAKAVDFFAGDRGQQVLPILVRCLNCAEAPLTVRGLICAAGVEGLIKLLHGEEGEVLLLEDEISKLVEFATDSLSKPTEISKRLAGSLRRLNQRSPETTLRSFVKRRYLGITNEDVEAWRIVRHASAHGGGLLGGTRTENQRDVDAYDRVLGLFIKLMLDGIGYKGPFFDRGLRQHVIFGPGVWP